MKLSIKLSISVAIGAALGYLYYYYFGCTNGCPITSNWHISTLYGAFAGFIYSFPFDKVFKKEKVNNDKQEHNN